MVVRWVWLIWCGNTSHTQVSYFPVPCMSASIIHLAASRVSSGRSPLVEVEVLMSVNVPLPLLRKSVSGVGS